MKMCQAFSANQHEVTLYAQQGHEEIDIFDYYGVKQLFTVQRLKYRRWHQLGNFLYSWQIKRLMLRDSLPDIIYGRHLMSLLFSADINCPLCYEVHNVPSTYFNGWLEGRLFRKRNFALLVCISGALRDEYLRLYPVLLKSRVVVAHDGADDPGPYVYKPKSELIFGSSGLRIGYVGHLYSGKGMEIISQMATLLPNEVFNVIGGTETDIKYWRENCPNNVIFHGFVPHGMLKDYYCSLDLVLAPLKQKISVAGGGGDIARFTSPLKLFEYMAYGKTIICSDLPVLREFLIDRKNVWFCSPDHVKEWVSAFETLSTDRELRERLARTAREDFKNNHTWFARAGSLLDTVKVV